MCVYCSSEKRDVRHHHFSTTKQRLFMLKHSKSGSMCPICQKVEPQVCEESVRRVVVSDSTMFGIWDQQERPNISQQGRKPLRVYVMEVNGKTYFCFERKLEILLIVFTIRYYHLSTRIGGKFTQIPNCDKIWRIFMKLLQKSSQFFHFLYA